jgi:hypothetical protein
MKTWLPSMAAAIIPVSRGPVIMLDIAAIVAYYAFLIAGWSSPVARRAHNPKVVGSNPAPATNRMQGLERQLQALFYCPMKQKGQGMFPARGSWKWLAGC